MFNVIYTWPAGDVSERCCYENVTSRQEENCFHCKDLIFKDCECIQLQTSRGDVRFLHKACAEKACHEAKEQPRPDKRLSDYLTEHTHA